VWGAFPWFFFQITNQNKLAVTYSDVILGWSQKAIESLAYDFGVVKFVFVFIPVCVAKS